MTPHTGHQVQEFPVAEVPGEQHRAPAAGDRGGEMLLTFDLHVRIKVRAVDPRAHQELGHGAPQVPVGIADDTLEMSAVDGNIVTESALEIVQRQNAALGETAGRAADKASQPDAPGHRPGAQQEAQRLQNGQKRPVGQLEA